jgi:hypothetical protein
MRRSETAVLFDPFVGAAEQREREGNAERLGGRQVDCQLDPGGLYHRQVCRLLALENPSGIHAGRGNDRLDLVGRRHMRAWRTVAKRQPWRNHGIAGRISRY